MPKTVHIQNGTKLTIEDNPFANGGEGDLYKILSPINYRNQVVKIYKPEKRTLERQKKIEYLIANPPPLNNNEHNSLIWVNEQAFESGKFIGFVMPIAQGEKLELLCHNKLPKNFNSEWSKFDFQSPNGLSLRLKICFNIAVAIYQVHKLGKYVLVDMKPENIMIQSNGLISIIDIDSVAILSNETTLFHAAVVTPDYTPPEYYNTLKEQKNQLNETWDRFSMSVIFYRLLCGIHPFTGSCVPPFEKYTSLAEMVEHGLFPHGPNSKYFKVIPPPHANFRKIETNIQYVFLKCFCDGHLNPAIRPSASEWCEVLQPSEVKIIKRPLPSKILFFPTIVYSRPLIFTPETKINFPSANYISPQNNFIQKIVGSLFGKSEKQKVIEQLIALENELKFKMSLLSKFEENLVDILTSFNESQDRILQFEKNEIETLKRNFALKINSYDLKSKQLLSEETNQLKALFNAYQEDSNSIDKKISDLYSNIVEKRIAVYKDQKNKNLNEINNLANDIENEKKQLLSNPLKLIQYSIKKYSNVIFSYYEPSNIEALSLYGFDTAADFLDVDASGRLRNKANQYVKVPGVAKVRGTQLNDWRKKKEIAENRIIIDGLQKKHNKSIELLSSTKIKIENDLNKYNTLFHQEFNIEKEKMDLMKRQNKEQYSNDAILTTSKFENSQNELLAEAKKNIFAYEHMLADISHKMKMQLNSNLDAYEKRFSTKYVEIKNFVAELQIAVAQLNHLQSEYLKKY